MWETKFDTSLNQVYYVNSLDGTVSFDLPCEVQSAKAPRYKGCEFARPNLLSRITSKLTLNRSRSHERKLELNKKPQSQNNERLDLDDHIVAATYLSSVAHMPLSLEDSYMLDEPLNLYNSDATSVSSDESIQSFYLELLPNDIYYDYEHSIYYDDKSMQYKEDDFEKEQERLELRLQILKELY